ncbi:reverse transcriptase domain-containing protein [Tanacetum coccineum]
MSTYLKNMAGYKQNQLKNKSFDEIQKLFDKAMKRVNIFVEMDTELVEGSSKRTGTEPRQEVTKKQKVDDVQETAKVDKDKETSELQSLMEVVPDEKEVAIDAIPLATKPASIVDFKIHREGKKGYYELIRADGSSKIYLVFSLLLKSIDREDLETLWRLVKAKHGYTMPEESYERVFWGDLKLISRINEVFGSILLVIMELLMKKLEILKKNIKFRGGLLGLKAFLKFLLLRSHLEIGLKNVDQSILYGISANVKTTYSSKSGNDLDLVYADVEIRRNFDGTIVEGGCISYPSRNRERMVETTFEKYNFAGVFIQIQAVLTLYAQGAYKVKVLIG